MLTGCRATASFSLANFPSASKRFNPQGTALTSFLRLWTHSSSQSVPPASRENCPSVSRLPVLPVNHSYFFSTVSRRSRSPSSPSPERISQQVAGSQGSVCFIFTITLPPRVLLPLAFPPIHAFFFCSYPLLVRLPLFSSSLCRLLLFSSLPSCRFMFASPRNVVTVRADSGQTDRQASSQTQLTHPATKRHRCRASRSNRQIPHAQTFLRRLPSRHS